MCACAAPSQVTEPRLFSPAALFARSAARRPFSTTPPSPPPPFSVRVAAFPCRRPGVCSRAWRGLSRPLIFGDKSLVRVGGWAGESSLCLLFPLPTIPPFQPKLKDSLSLSVAFAAAAAAAFRFCDLNEFSYLALGVGGEERREKSNKIAAQGQPCHRWGGRAGGRDSLTLPEEFGETGRVA